MISFIKGKILFKDKESVVVDVGGVGLKVFCLDSDLKNFSINEEVALFTSFYLREERAELYGFLKKNQLQLFEILKSIPGIGPKTALSLSQFETIENLKENFEKGSISHIKGLGKKKLQKILLELTGKIHQIEKEKQKEEKDAELLEVLTSLGFKQKKVKEILPQIPPDIKDVQEKIKIALRLLKEK